MTTDLPKTKLTLVQKKKKQTTKNLLLYLQLLQVQHRIKNVTRHANINP